MPCEETGVSWVEGKAEEQGNGVGEAKQCDIAHLGEGEGEGEEKGEGEGEREREGRERGRESGIAQCSCHVLRQ